VSDEALAEFFLEKADLAGKVRFLFNIVKKHRAIDPRPSARLPQTHHKLRRIISRRNRRGKKRKNFSSNRNLPVDRKGGQKADPAETR
tara:strand:+ start:200 stop:463 length:264 start_codon:yes stop_codon:yes gene_type:complete